MDRQPVLETDRLLVRPLAEADREDLFAVASDPALWEQHPIHDRWRRDVFDGFFDQALVSQGAFAIIDRKNERLIGTSRYDRFDEADGGTVEIGWTFLARNCWGTGLNHELKRAMLAHAFGSVVRVEFRVGDTNYRSRYALDAIGAERTRRYELERYQGKRVVHLVYEITRDSFATGPLA